MLVCEGATIEIDRAKVYESEESPLILSRLERDKMYAFAVRIVTKQGHKSDLSETFVIEDYTDGKPHERTSYL